MTLRATYRIQFHREFPFDRARELATYFAQLGISHLYSSPILTARAGSMHGYDVVDHSRINPELGGETAFRALAGALREHGIGIILDIVPNHMAVDGGDNPYWLDVLEKGRDSVFATMFDIDWDAGAGTSHETLVVPMLGTPLAECIASGEITLGWDARLAKLAFFYHDNRYPLRLDDYALVIGDATDPSAADLSRFGDHEMLMQLLSHQHFRLVFWGDAGDRINWRRFFDVTNLAAIRVEDDAVFEQTHATIFRLFGEGLIDGVRVDHVDGLADPGAYCRRLRARLEALLSQRPESLPREPAIILVEKVLADGESVPADWGVDGTTGYDFMNAVSAIQHDPAGEATFTNQWRRLGGPSPDFEWEERRARRELLDSAFSNALRSTAAAFAGLSSDGDVRAIERALGLLIEHFRAYRTYARGDAPDPPPGDFFVDASDAARRDAADDPEVIAALSLVVSVMQGERAECGAAACHAVRRLNQLTAPIAAKAVEDTAFYRYGRLLSRNDVGFTPGRFSWTTSEFHADNARRAATTPRTLVATATHDHKRGEDARARLAALSEVPTEWTTRVDEWFALNAPLKPQGVSCTDEYQLYQTLVGAWPLDLTPTDRAGVAALEQRILAWREKSLREEKLGTAWDRPNVALESSHADFVRRILDPSHAFVAALHDFAMWLAPAGALNGLVGAVLRCTSPGVPDLYQGGELWDASLVDPDNRRPVNFDARRTGLANAGAPADLLKNWKTGAVKLAVIRRLLELRQQLAELFSAGEYRPLATSDARVLAFARTDERHTLVVVVPRASARAAIAQGMPRPDSSLRRDSVSLPGEWREYDWRNVLERDVRVERFDPESPVWPRLPALVLLADSRMSKSA